jgi:hypothetical protein
LISVAHESVAHLSISHLSSSHEVRVLVWRDQSGQVVAALVGVEEEVKPPAATNVNLSRVGHRHRVMDGRQLRFARDRLSHDSCIRGIGACWWYRG